MQINSNSFSSRFFWGAVPYRGTVFHVCLVVFYGEPRRDCAIFSLVLNGRTAGVTSVSKLVVPMTERKDRGKAELRKKTIFCFCFLAFRFVLTLNRVEESPPFQLNI